MVLPSDEHNGLSVYALQLIMVKNSRIMIQSPQKYPAGIYKIKSNHLLLEPSPGPQFLPKKHETKSDHNVVSWIQADRTKDIT